MPDKTLLDRMEKVDKKKVPGAVYVRPSAKKFSLMCKGCLAIESVKVSIVHCSKIHILCLRCGHEDKL